MKRFRFYDIPIHGYAWVNHIPLINLMTFIETKRIPESTKLSWILELSEKLMWYSIEGGTKGEYIVTIAKIGKQITDPKFYNINWVINLEII